MKSFYKRLFFVFLFILFSASIVITHYYQRLETINIEVNNRIAGVQNLLVDLIINKNQVALWSFFHFLKKDEISCYYLTENNTNIFVAGSTNCISNLKKTRNKLTYKISDNGLDIASLNLKRNDFEILKKTLNDDIILLILMLLAFLAIYYLKSNYDKKEQQRVIEIMSFLDVREFNFNKTMELLKTKKGILKDDFILKVIDNTILFLEVYNKKLKLSAVGEVAGQVAHDIRSPLAALDMVVKDIKDLPEAKRIILRSASARIHDIANDLLQKNRTVTNQNFLKQNEKTQTVLMAVIIQNILTEKRIQFRSKINIKIHASFKDTSYGLFAKVQPQEMKRIISNLLNNSVEALDKSGTIEIELCSQQNDSIELRIIDNGPGIPQDVLAKLGQHGETYGKPCGNGLGLYHAKKCINSWGGTFQIDSLTEQGTTVTINLPKAAPPETFRSTITLKPDTTLVIIDDDESVHQIWDEKLKSLELVNNNIDVMHFSCPQDAETWMYTNRNKSAVYLIDYEFLGHEVNGLQLIRKTCINGNAYLVTSRFEEEKIQEECVELKVGLIPKGMVALVPFAINDKVPKDDLDQDSTLSILVDDDELVRMIWQTSALKNNTPLKVYSQPENLLSCIKNLSKNSIFYIDSNLSNNIKGEKVALELYNLGHRNIYLTTGYEKEMFQEMHWVKDIIGKSPPWE